MKCSLCKNRYDIQDFNSLRKYDDEDYLVNKIDMCSNCWNKISKKEEDGKLDKLYEDGYKLYKIERCSVYDDCEKIGNIRRMCERKEEVDRAPDFGFGYINPVKWCNPAEAGIITASVRLYELFDNYDKNSTKLSNNMLNYTKNMHHLTWVLLAFAVVGFILTFINAYIAYLQLIK